MKQWVKQQSSLVAARVKKRETTRHYMSFDRSINEELLPSKTKQNKIQISSIV